MGTCQNFCSGRKQNNFKNYQNILSFWQILGRMQTIWLLPRSSSLLNPTVFDLYYAASCISYGWILDGTLGAMGQQCTVTKSEKCSTNSILGLTKDKQQQAACLWNKFMQKNYSEQIYHKGNCNAFFAKKK